MRSQTSSMTVGIPVRDLSEATAWYRALLGSRREIAPAPGVHEFELLPRSWLQLLASAKAERSECIVRIGVCDIDVEHKRVSELGGDPSPIETVPGVVRYFEFWGPYGNRLSFYQVRAGI